jgi:hypothetical protein
MFVHGISHLVTDNLEDFCDFDGLVAHPQSSR